MKPHSITLLITGCLTALMLVCYVFPANGIQIGAVTLKMPELKSITGGETADDTHIITDSVVVYEETDTVQKQISNSTALRIIHYGDSQIEGDRMTKNIRNGLQSRFGGGGVGLIPLHQTIGSMSLQQKLIMNDIQQTAKQGPKRYLAYGPKSGRRETKVYGPMAQVAVMNDSIVKGSEQLKLTMTSVAKDTTAYFTQIRILRQYDSIITLRQPQRNYTLKLNGKGDIYGISLETKTGVIVDNIQMRGCAGTIFTSIDPKALRHYYAVTNTALFILQYGGNVMPYTKTVSSIDSYKERLRKQIRYIKRLVPEADLLFVGPSDMHTTIEGTKTTYPLLPKMDKTLKDLAAEENIGYWSLFEAMGGKGGMTRWVAQGLAGSDGVHFTRKGADKAGNMLTEWLLQGYDEYEELK